MPTAIIGWFPTQFEDRPIPVYLVFGVTTGTSGETVNLNASKIHSIVVTRILSSYSPDKLKVEVEYAGSGGSFTIRVTNVAPSADTSTGEITPSEDTTTSITVHWMAVVEKE